jgi:hypothetical protein
VWDTFGAFGDQPMCVAIQWVRCGMRTMFGKVRACISDLDKLKEEVRLEFPAKIRVETYTRSVVDDERDACVHDVMPMRRGGA